MLQLKYGQYTTVQYTFPCLSPCNSSANQSVPSTSSPPPPTGNIVFVGGKRELTGIQPLVASLSPSVRLASSALLIGAAIAAGYGLGSRFGKAQGNVATVDRAVALGAAAVVAAYAVSEAVPDVAAVDLHNYMAGCDDPKVVSKDDIERIAKKNRVSKQVRHLMRSFVIYIARIEELKGDEADTIINFKKALGIDEPDAVAMHMKIGRRLFRQRLETGDRDGDVEQRRVGHMCYYC